VTQSKKHRAKSEAPFRVTLIGSTAAEWTDFKGILRHTGVSVPLMIKHEPAIAGVPFPREVVHAIVLTPTGIAHLTSVDVDAIRLAMKPGTCRVYLLVAQGEALPPNESLLDDFIQRTSDHGSNAIAQQIIAFFREADDFNRRNTFLAFRDLTCLGAYRFLKFLWPVSYLFAALHVINMVIQRQKECTPTSPESVPVGHMVEPFGMLFQELPVLMLTDRNGSIPADRMQASLFHARQEAKPVATEENETT
jgi:hypothetical protein